MSMSIRLGFRIVAVGVVALGLMLGIAFGAGVAYGRGDPKTVQSGLTAQQLQSLLGVSGAQAAASQASAGGAASGQGGTAGPSAAGGATGFAGLLGARSSAGLVTAVQGQTLTIDTRTGSQKVNLNSATNVSLLTRGTSAGLKEGMAVVVSGTRKDDGSFDATTLSQVAPELQALVVGTGAGAAGTATPAATPGGR